MAKPEKSEEVVRDQLISVSTDEVDLILTALDDSILAQQFLLAQNKEAQARRFNSNPLDTEIAAIERHDLTVALRQYIMVETGAIDPQALEA